MRCALLLLAFAAAPAWADIEPGNWEITSTTQVSGEKEPARLVETRCLTAEDARDPSRVFGPSGAGCQLTNRSDTGSVYTFAVTCGTQPPLQGSGSVRYRRDSMEGEFDLTLAGITARSRIAARRLGGC